MAGTVVILRRLVLGVIGLGGVVACSWAFGALANRVYPALFVDAGVGRNLAFVMVGFICLAATAVLLLAVYHVGREIDGHLDSSS